MNIITINTRLNKELCIDTWNELQDSSLMNEYKNSKSMKIKIGEFENILNKYTDEKTKNKILDEYILRLVPIGTKSVIRGLKFNYIVSKFLNKIILNNPKLEITFEQAYDSNIISEIPDWLITDKSSNKTIIGMNQIDLWSGGHQINRASKYIYNNKINTENCKLLCVVCKPLQLKTSKSKIYKIIKHGFDNDTLCYLNNLENIIFTFFNL